MIADIQKRNAELQARFALCEEWQDADQWEALGQMYFSAGYVINAGVCFRRADGCRQTERVASCVPFVAVAEMAPL